MALQPFQVAIALDVINIAAAPACSTAQPGSAAAAAAAARTVAMAISKNRMGTVHVIKGWKADKASAAMMTQAVKAVHERTRLTSEAGSSTIKKRKKT